jgi:hypothetical protein
MIPRPSLKEVELRRSRRIYATAHPQLHSAYRGGRRTCAIGHPRFLDTLSTIRSTASSPSPFCVRGRTCRSERWQSVTVLTSAGGARGTVCGGGDAHDRRSTCTRHPERRPVVVAISGAAFDSGPIRLSRHVTEGKRPHPRRESNATSYEPNGRARFTGWQNPCRPASAGTGAALPAPSPHTGDWMDAGIVVADVQFVACIPQAIRGSRQSVRTDCRVATRATRAVLICGLTFAPGGPVSRRCQTVTAHSPPDACDREPRLCRFHVSVISCDASSRSTCLHPARTDWRCC